MTSPTDSFEYNDDSVVARVAVDIPSQAVSDISQLTAAMSAMRTELEAISRAQSDWVSYLQQMPVIVEQSNQALRNQITIMERMSYLQSEIGPGGTPAFSGEGGAGVRPGGGEGGGGPGGGYSTAAPAAYTNPFEGMESGTGAHGGGNAGAAGAAGALEAMSGVDARTYANMAAARGLPINPGILGAIGGAAAGYLGISGGNGGGSGNGEPADSTSPQQGNSARKSGKVSNQNERGQSIDSESQDEPSDPTPDSPGWRGALKDLMDGVKDGIRGEMGGAGGGKGIGGKIASIGGMGSKALGGKGGMLGTMFKGMGMAGTAAVAMHQIQNIGEDVTEYQQLGSVRGGDYATGMKMELTNRIRALDPFVNLPQTREAMQAAYGAGFSGSEVSDVQSAAITNFKELGVSMQDTARMLAAAMANVPYNDKEGRQKAITGLGSTLNTMKELSADGGASLPDRQQQLAKAMEDLVSGGMDEETVRRGVLQMQEGFSDKRVMSKIGPDIATNALNSPTLGAIGATRLGINGVYPGAMKAAMAANGVSSADFLQVVAKEMAQAVEGVEPHYNKVGMFMDLMNQQGAGLPSYEAAEELLGGVTGEGPAFADKGAQAVKAHGTELNHQTNWNPISYLNDIGGSITDNLASGNLSSIPGDFFNAIRGYHKPSESAQQDAAMMPDGSFSPSGNASPGLPNSASAVPASVNTSGQVTGNLTITIDQNGNASAPASIQLTGTQVAALLGQGSAAMNNPGPGENFSTPPFRS